MSVDYCGFLAYKASTEQYTKTNFVKKCEIPYTFPWYTNTFFLRYKNIK